MKVVENVIEIGNRIRERNKLDLRQPLGCMTVNHPDLKIRELLDKHKENITRKLNIKRLIIDQYPHQLRFRANYAKLGPKYKKRVRDISEAIEKISTQEWETQETFEVLGETIFKDEIIVSSNYSNDNSETDGELCVRLDLTLSLSLLQEGMLQEIVSAFKAQRKALKLRANKAIDVFWFSPYVDLTETILLNHEYLGQELSATFHHEFSLGSERLEIDTITGQKILTVKIVAK